MTSFGNERNLSGMVVLLKTFYCYVNCLIMKESLDIGNLNLVTATTLFLVLLLVIFIIYRAIYRLLRRKFFRSQTGISILFWKVLKVPGLWVIYWTLFKVFSEIYLKNHVIFPYLQKINTLLIIFSITWVLLQIIKVGEFYLLSKFDISQTDNLIARKNVTQINVFKGIATTIIIIVAFSISLMTFDQARTIGLSLLTSAGIIGIIVGFAAQKSIGLILAGIQIAITQPIRLDDVVVVEGEWGRIEEITLTYVVVNIWDQRRLILPVTWFLEKPFQNWTRKSSDIIGTVFLYVDYSFPVDSIRAVLPGLLEQNSDWNGIVMNVQVTNVTERHKEIRVLLSSSNSSKNWNLRTKIREELIDYINKNFPGSFSKIRIKNDDD